MKVYNVLCSWENENIIMGSYSSYEKALDTILKNLEGKTIEIEYGRKEYDEYFIIKFNEFWNNEKPQMIKYTYEIIEEKIK